MKFGARYSLLKPEPPVRDFDCGGQTLALRILADTNFAYFQAFR